MTLVTQGAVRIPLKTRPKESLAGKGMELYNHDLVEYYGKLLVGNPPQSFDVVFDTTMDWTWLPSTNCTIKCHSVPKYDPTQSNTTKNSTTQVSFHYTTGETEGNITGYIYEEKIQLNGMTLDSQYFLAVWAEEDIFKKLQSSGFVGMTADSSSTYPSLMRSLRAKNLIKSNIFAMKLATRKEDPSELVFGDNYTDLVGSNDKTAWENNQDSTYWAVKATKIRFGDKERVITNGVMLLDTAEDSLRLRQSEFAIIDEYLRGKFKCMYDSNYQLSCYVGNNDDRSQFPKLSIVLSNVTLELTADDYVVFGNEAITGKRIATIKVDVTPDWKQRYNEIGTVLLRKYTMIYDADKHRVGFVSASESTPTDSGIILAILLPLFVVSTLIGGYFLYRKHKYGAMCGRAVTTATKSDDKPLLNPAAATTL